MSTPNIDRLAEDAGIDPSVLRTLAEALAGNPEDAEETEDAPTVRADQFASLGFVAIGTGDAPSEGDVIEVPTKAGKLNSVRVTELVDTSQFRDHPKGTWAVTYKRLKRGES